MDYNLLPNLQFCKEIVDSYSSFLFYTSISPSVISILIGLGVFLKTKNKLSAKYLFLISVTFSLWVLSNLMIWFTYDRASIMMFLWSGIGFLSALLFIFILFFFYTFVFEKELPNWLLLLSLGFILPIALLTPTNFNLLSFDIKNCVANENEWFLYYYYGIGILAFIFIILLFFWNTNKTSSNLKPILNKVNLFMTVGLELFILTFVCTGFIASYLVDAGFIPDFGIEQYGIIMMVVLMGVISFLIVQYKIFNLKILGAQFLVIGLIILNLSQFFFIENSIGFWLAGITVFLSISFGFLLIISVRNEIKQKEKIEKLAVELQMANERLKVLDKQKSEFVSLASHQLRSPLTAIKGYVSLILEGDMGEISRQVNEALKKVFVSANSLAILVNDYLNVSKIELGQLKYVFEDTSLSALIKEVVDDTKPNIENLGLKLDLNIEKKEIKINADKNKLKQVFLNLVDNAIKYSNKGGNISVSIIEEDGQGVFKVKDNGIGVKPENIPTIFEKFSRTPNGVKKNTTGSGLGLYLAKRIVDDHKGTIYAESEGEGKGTTFVVKLKTI